MPCRKLGFIAAADNDRDIGDSAIVVVAVSMLTTTTIVIIIAMLITGRPYIGIELDPAHHRTARDRIRVGGLRPWL